MIAALLLVKPGAEGSDVLFCHKCLRMVRPVGFLPDFYDLFQPHDGCGILAQSIIGQGNVGHGGGGFGGVLTKGGFSGLQALPEPFEGYGVIALAVIVKADG